MHHLVRCNWMACRVLSSLGIVEGQRRPSGDLPSEFSGIPLPKGENP